MGYLFQRIIPHNSGYTFMLDTCEETTCNLQVNIQVNTCSWKSFRITQQINYWSEKKTSSTWSLIDQGFKYKQTLQVLSFLLAFVKPNLP